MTQAPPGAPAGQQTFDLDLAAWPPPPFRAPGPPRVGQDGTRHFDGVTYASTLGYRPCLLDVRVPAAAGPVAAVVWIHGGGWLEGDRRYPPPTVPAELLHGTVLGAGLALVCIDYRHSLEAPFPAQLHDVKAAIRYVRRHAAELGIDPHRIGVMGESAGGHLAALAGLVQPDGGDAAAALEGGVGVQGEDSSVRAAVCWYPATDLGALLGQPLPMPPAPDGTVFPDPFASLLGGTPQQWPELARTASPVTYAGGATPPPFLLLHGTEDRLLPYSQSESLAAALKGAGGEVTLVPVEGADHIFLGSPDVTPLVTQSIAFLARHLAA
ncbi:acetyl esterase/lipase [Streptomyces sp. Ag109_G2-6]|uniref:alpha/beta hydrolase n=1 Tax=Streptomyces TaxID=1883 RepID=UPI0009A55275|nr:MULTISPECIES: alpha/beta hydrolase [Streptomyces]RPF29931.1 acetyl esterase/lipase [Streptomyces sp. Ag109_G2-6]